MSSIAPFSGWTAASPYAVVLLSASLLCIVCAITSWRRRPLPGAAQAVVVMLAAAIWALFYSFELTASGMTGKLFWAKAEYLGIAVLPVAWLVFAYAYTITGRPFSRRLLALLYVVPLVTVVLAATNDLHGLIWSNVSLDYTGPFPHLALTHGIWFWISLAYSYVFLAIATILLVIGAYRCERPHLYRTQVLLLLAAAATPWIGNLFYVVGLLPYGGVLDPTPLAFAVASLLVTLNMSRFRLFSLQPALLPIARGQLLEQMNDGVLVVDANGLVAYANPTACSMLGRSPSDVVGKPAAKLPDDLSTAIDWGSTDNEEQRFGLTLGDAARCRYYDVDVSAIGPALHRTEAGLGHLLVLRDVTEERQAEAALRQSEERFKGLSSMASEGVMIHENGIIVDANDTFAKLSGHGSVDELIGKSGLDIMPFTAESRQDVVDRMRGDTPEAYEVQLVKPDGTTFWAETEGRIVTYRGRPARLVLMRDIDGRKQAEVALQSSVEQLRHSQRTEAVGRLAGGIAHDFNNMLGVILGHAEVVLSQVDPGEQVYKDIQEIGKAAKRSAGITQQLLGFARQQVAVPMQLDLNDAVEGTVHLLDRLVGEDIELVWKPGHNIGAVLMDPSQLDQILVNLCINARDAIASGGCVTVETEAIEVDEAFCAERPGCTPGVYSCLTVSDTGCGMQPEILEHVFEPFFTTKEPGKGTGLGLATVYGIVKQNRGYIEVQSEPRHGARVHVYLPRHTGKQAKTQRPDAPAIADAGTEMLLIVEDEVSLLRLSERVLKGLGYTVLAANTPSQALRLAESHIQELALVVTDVIMPEMNGRELVERLRALRPGLRALYISGYAAEVISDRGILGRGVFFLQKPYTPQQLAGNVRAALENRWPASAG